MVPCKPLMTNPPAFLLCNHCFCFDFLWFCLLWRSLLPEATETEQRKLQLNLLIELWPLKELLRLSTEPPAFSLGLSRESVSGGGDCGEPGMTPGLDSWKGLNHFGLVNEHRHWQELIHLQGKRVCFPALYQTGQNFLCLSTYLAVLSCSRNPTQAW